MKKSLFTYFSVFVFMVSCLFSCDSSSTTSRAQSQTKQLRVNIAAEPPTLNPGKTTDTTSANVLTMLFDTLVRKNVNGELELSLAEKVDISDDGLEYRFTLRPGILWSNGDPLTAYDFEYAWKSVIDPKFASSYAFQMHLIKNAKPANNGELALDQVGIKAENNSTLVVCLEHPAPYFLELTANIIYCPVNRNIAIKNPQWAFEATADYVCCGPFKLKEWKHNDYLVVVKNDLYWDRDVVSLDEIYVTMISNSSTELTMFENGELDWAGAPLSGLPSDAIPSLKSRSEFSTYQMYGTYFYEFNTHDKVLANKKIRQGLSYAINRQELVDNIIQTHPDIATAIVPTTLKVSSFSFFQDHNVELAQNLFNEGLKELALSKENMPSLRLCFNANDPGHEKIAQAIQQQWRLALNIEVSLENSEWNVYLDNMRNHNFQIGRMAWMADYNDPLDFLNIFRYADNGTNHSQWESQEFQQLLQESDHLLDKAARLAVLEKAEKILMEEMPIAPIYFYKGSYMKRPEVKGVYLGGNGHADFKWAYIAKD